MTKSKWLVAVVAVAMLAGSASAATMNLQATPAFILDGNTFDALPASVLTTGYSGPVFIEVNFTFTLSGVPTGQQLANLNFGINKGAAGLVMDPFNGAVVTWNAFPTNTPNSLYSSTPADLGSNTTDLQGIVAEIGLAPATPNRNDPRPTLAANPVMLGTVDMVWDGHTATTLVVTPGIPSSNKVFSLYINGVITPQTGTMNGASISFSPEPVTMVLLAIGGILGLRRRK